MSVASFSRMDTIQSAQIVLPCESLDETIGFLKDQLGFRTDIISPADDPSIVVMSGYGLSLRLERQMNQTHSSPVATTIRLLLKDQADTDADQITELLAPNGTRFQLLKPASSLPIPVINPSFVLSRKNTDAHWVKGRAGMNYRDLIPGRQGGRFIASHIQIPNGGPVNDHVHYHHIRFQMIYVYQGWVRLVYEDQGQPFILHAGDCVLQPPLIRHRVLESSPGLEVVEVACPAVHDTYIDHNMELPNTREESARLYHGQHFVKFIAAEEKAPWQPWRLPGFEYQDLRINAATKGLAGAKVIRPSGVAEPQTYQHSAEFVFLFVLHGQLTLNVKGKTIEQLTDGDAFVLPSNTSYAFGDRSTDVQFLEVSLPGTFPTHHEQE